MLTVSDGGKCTFELFQPNADSVRVCGTFNEWSRSDAPMTYRGDGWWTCTITIKPGDHRFQYLVNDHEWVADFAAHGVEKNGFGCWVSHLWIEAREVGLDRTIEPKPVRRKTSPTPMIGQSSRDEVPDQSIESYLESILGESPTKAA